MTFIRDYRTKLVRLGFSFLCAGMLHACAFNGDVSAKKAADAAQFNAQLGAQYLNRGQLEQAREKLLKALEQDEANALAHVTYAQLQARVSQPTSALKHFKLALSLEPDEPDHNNSFGIYLCQEGRFDEAQEQFRVAADNAYYGTPEFALDNAGICMLQAERLSEAENYLREALRVNPQFASAYLNMADLMHRYERLAVADAYYQRFTAYGPDTAESLWLGVKIKRDAGKIDTAEQFATRLLNQFPASKQAGEYLSRPIQ